MLRLPVVAGVREPLESTSILLNLNTCALVQLPSDQLPQHALPLWKRAERWVPSERTLAGQRLTMLYFLVVLGMFGLTAAITTVLAAFAMEGWGAYWLGICAPLFIWAAVAVYLIWYYRQFFAALPMTFLGIGLGSVQTLMFLAKLDGVPGLRDLTWVQTWTVTWFLFFCALVSSVIAGEASVSLHLSPRA